MSWQPCPDPTPGDVHAADLIETVIVPRARDLGSFEVRRALPSDKRQMVGPFIFFDQMGPSEFLLGARFLLHTLPDGFHRIDRSPSVEVHGRARPSACPGGPRSLCG